MLWLSAAFFHCYFKYSSSYKEEEREGEDERWRDGRERRGSKTKLPSSMIVWQKAVFADLVIDRWQSRRRAKTTACRYSECFNSSACTLLWLQRFRCICPTTSLTHTYMHTHSGTEAQWKIIWTNIVISQYLNNLKILFLETFHSEHYKFYQIKWKNPK